MGPAGNGADHQSSEETLPIIREVGEAAGRGQDHRLLSLQGQGPLTYEVECYSLLRSSSILRTYQTLALATKP